MTATEQPLSPAEYEVVARALNELPPRCRASLLLHRGGLTYAQVAGELGIDEAQVRLLVERAMEYLLERTSVSLRSVPHKTLDAGEPLPSTKRACTCVSCGSCGGTGTVWFAFDGQYLGSHRSDDLDELQRCDDCEGSGLSEVCDLCRDLEEDDEY